MLVRFLLVGVAVGMLAVPLHAQEAQAPGVAEATEPRAKAKRGRRSMAKRSSLAATESVSDVAHDLAARKIRRAGPVLPPARPDSAGQAAAGPPVFAAAHGPSTNWLATLFGAPTAQPAGTLLLPSTPRARIDALIAHHARLNGVPESLVHRVVVRESRYNPRAVGRGGAMGLMQIKTATARGMGYTGGPAGLLDAETNLTYAVKYLGGAYKVARGNHDLAVQHYARGYYYAAKRQGFTARGAQSSQGSRFVQSGVPALPAAPAANPATPSFLSFLQPSAAAPPTYLPDR